MELEMNTCEKCSYLMALMSYQSQGSSTGIGNCNCRKVRPIMMWICDDVEHQGGQWKQRAMMTLPFPSRVSHLYDNRNRDVVTFLEIGVDIYMNEVVTAKGKVPLEIN